MRIQVLYRHHESGLIEPAVCNYEGHVPEKVWKRLNRRFLKLDAGRYFYPLEPMDAYQDAVAQVTEKAERIARGEIVLRDASAETYLTSAANLAFLKFHERKVQPARAIYHRVANKTAGRGAVGEDRFDIDNYDGTQDCPDKTMTDISDEPCEESVPLGTAMTAQQLVESLPGYPSRREREEKATAVLGEICERLLATDRKIGREITDVFAAYVAADGNHFAAAHLVHIGKNRWYRSWPRWLALARRAAEVGEKERALRN